jgi:hypothetical protein
MNQPVHHQPESPSGTIAGVTVYDVPAQDHTGAQPSRCAESVEATVTLNHCGWCLGAHPITACPWGAWMVAFALEALTRPVRVWA